MTCSSSRIDLAARRLLSSIAGTRNARVSAMALAHMRGAGKALMDAGLIVQRGSAMSVVAEGDLDDTPTSVIAHPITGHHGHLGNAAWHDERASARRQVYELDMAAAARRVVARLDCSLGKDPVPHLDGAVLDFETARLPKRRARVGIWVARGLTTPAVFEEFRQLVARRPADGFRVVLVLDPPDRHRFRFVRGHEFVALADVVDHEDGLAIAPEVLSARLLKRPSHKGPVWVSGDGGVLIVHGRWHEFTGGKQKIAVAMLAEARLDGEAQAFRWDCFERTLSDSYLRAYLKRLPDFDDIEAEDRAMAHATAYSSLLHALQFFLDWPALDRAAELLLARPDEIDGDHYDYLAPAAEALSARHPLAATLVLRAMIDFTVTRTRAKRYRFAAEHLASCARLAGDIPDFGAFETHDAYVARLKKANGRKFGFWSLIAT